MEPREILIAMSIYHRGDWEKIYDAVQRRDFLETPIMMSLIRKMKCNAVTYFDKEYPEQLKQVYHPPFVLFYYGDLSLVQDENRCLAVVGTREPTEVGIKMTRKIVSKTAKKYVTVSGLAIGVDRIAHETAIRSGGKTVAVLGSGINICYPIENEDLFRLISKNHLLMSEYPEGVTPSQLNFPNRNRIVAGLSKAVLITESKIRSGTSITAKVALELGRDVMCVPSSDYSNSGCNLHIKQGAALVENAKDVLFVLGDEKLL